MSDLEPNNTDIQEPAEQTPVVTEEQKEKEAPAPKSEEVKYENGQLLKFVRIRFPGNSKSFPFLLGEREYKYGQQVVAMSDRGIDIGYINSFPYEAKFREAMLPLKSIEKVADQEDFEKMASMKGRETEAENICKELIEKYELEMDLTHVELIQFGKKAVFYFIAPKRVDFRNLVKDLVSRLKLRVELRQISVRDRAAALGGIGPCGRELCCSTFLGNYGRVNIRMAKNQNMALNPTRLNGLCGQLKCCLSYEDNVYTHKRESLPSEGTFVELVNGDRGKVLKLHILILQFDMLTDKGAIRRYTFDQFDADLATPHGWKFPDRFDHVTNETSTVIGKVKEEIADDYDEYDEDDEELEAQDDVTEVALAPEQVEEEAVPEEAPKKEERPREQNPKNRRNNRRRRNNNNRRGKPKPKPTA